MKRRIALFVLVAVASVTVSFAESAPTLEVHEWGTFTVVCGSDGQPIRWYQPRTTLVELPAFVIPRGLSINETVPRKYQLTKSGNETVTLPPAVAGDALDAAELPAFVLPRDQIRPAAIHGFVVAGKTGTATNSASHGFFVRMETPVIYFYPNQPMRVSVEAKMQQGHITEWFPQHAGERPDGAMRWEGKLASPTGPGAAHLLPVDLTHGARYVRARSVPNAWFFHTGIGTQVVDAPAQSPANEAWEKFIFYRGAGDELPPYRVEAPAKDAVRLSHFGDGREIRSAFLLEISNRGARWSPLNPLPEMTGNQGTPSLEGGLNTPVKALPAVQEELAAAMRGALIEAGLTTDEAKAMVATWGDVWFSETGTRVLAILPRAWVDSVLPLTVAPKPSNLTRVFVARFEVFTQEREQALLSLLAAGENPGPETLEKFRDLHLDRFATAALERARRLADERMRAAFTVLQAADKTPTGPVSRPEKIASPGP